MSFDTPVLSFSLTFLIYLVAKASRLLLPAPCIESSHRITVLQPGSAVHFDKLTSRQVKNNCGSGTPVIVYEPDSSFKEPLREKISKGELTLKYNKIQNAKIYLSAHKPKGKQAQVCGRYGELCAGVSVSFTNDKAKVNTITYDVGKGKKQ